MKRGTIRHLMSREPALAACGTAWVGSALTDPRCADNLDDVSCRLCLISVAFSEHAFRAARANRRAVELLAAQQIEINALRTQVAALQEAGARPGLATTRTLETLESHREAG